MTQPEPSGLAHAEPAPGTAAGFALFPPAELLEFRRADKAAARNIVVLMLSIFVLGLTGYIFVCLWVGGVL